MSPLHVRHTLFIFHVVMIFTIVYVFDVFIIINFSLSRDINAYIKCEHYNV